MLDKMTRFLFGRKAETKQADESKSDLSPNPTRLAHADSSNAADLFLSSIKGVGHPEYPILDSDYSPSSRVPCTDLVPFISERIVEGDTNSIKLVMQAVIEANPGLGAGVDWIAESVENILSIPFENYISFPSAAALPELKALFIVAAKDGGGREFLITGEIPRLISWACIALQPSWSTELYSLATKANSWIVKMAEDIPYWRDFQKFDIRDIPNNSIETEFRESIISLTPAARLQLFFAVEKGGGSLPVLTGQIRSLGINVVNTSQEIIESGLVLPSASPEVIESAHSQRELVELCESIGASYRKSWKKERLVAALKEKNPAVLDEMVKAKNLVSPNFQAYPELRNVVRIADEHQIGFKLLCFA